MKKLRILAAIIVVAIGLNYSSMVIAASQQAERITATPIEHLIVLMQENHTFDNYFGTFPGADGIPAGTKMPVDPENPSAGFVEPWHLGDYTITDISHNNSTWLDQYNDGKMDGFVAALNKRNEDGPQAMGYYDYRDIPYYWNLASNYVLFDRFFSSAMEGSFANHMYWVAAKSPSDRPGQDLANLLRYVPTIFDHLEKAGISWKFYVENYDPTITYLTQDSEGVGAKSAQVIWVPLLNFERFIFDPVLSSHIVDLSEYFTDLRNNTLPAVSYIVPSGASEHPPQAPRSGERSVKNLIQELMRSESWNNSAFLLLYDDWGGWYDHVIPPRVDDAGYGPRVPAILVSTYAKKGHIDSTELDFTSILKFIEENWGVQYLTIRDKNANNFLSAFDFEQTPRRAKFLAAKYPDIPEEKADASLLVFSSYGVAVVLVVGAVVLVTVKSRSRK